MEQINSKKYSGLSTLWLNQKEMKAKEQDSSLSPGNCVVERNYINGK